MKKHLLCTATEAEAAEARRPGLFDAAERHAARIADGYNFRLLPDCEQFPREVVQGGVKVFIELTGRVCNDLAYVSVYTDGAGYYWGWNTVQGGSWEKVYTADGYWMAAKRKLEINQAKKAKEAAEKASRQQKTQARRGGRTAVSA